jgi:hypothetical protein
LALTLQDGSFCGNRVRVFCAVVGTARLILASGTRDTPLRMANALEWAKFWQTRPDAPWGVRHLIIDGGTHAANIGDVYRQAMNWLFREGIARAP